MGTLKGGLTARLTARLTGMHTGRLTAAVHDHGHVHDHGYGYGDGAGISMTTVIDTKMGRLPATGLGRARSGPGQVQLRRHRVSHGHR
jgi:hypothetical protein